MSNTKMETGVELFADVLNFPLNIRKRFKKHFQFQKFFLFIMSVDMQVAVLTTLTKFFARKPEKFGLRAKKIVVFVSSI